MKPWELRYMTENVAQNHKNVGLGVPKDKDLREPTEHWQ